MSMSKWDFSIFDLKTSDAPLVTVAYAALNSSLHGVKNDFDVGNNLSEVLIFRLHLQILS